MLLLVPADPLRPRRADEHLAPEANRPEKVVQDQAASPAGHPHHASEPRTNLTSPYFTYVTLHVLNTELVANYSLGLYV